jgi:hypothetical protein
MTPQTVIQPPIAPEPDDAADEKSADTPVLADQNIDAATNSPPENDEIPDVEPDAPEPDEEPPAQGRHRSGAEQGRVAVKQANRAARPK